MRRAARESGSWTATRPFSTACASSAARCGPTSNFPSKHRALGKYAGWLVDYRAIRWGDRAFAADDSIALHHAHRRWLQDRLLQPFAGATVVITHHPPHPGSIAPKFATHPLNPAFVSNLEDLMGRARLWIHGHTHSAFDYIVRGTRVVCNARGYVGEDTGFRGDFVVDVHSAVQ